VVEGRGGQNTGAERMQLTNLLNENIESLRLGFEEKFDYELHQDGTQDAEALAGLDSIISTTPTTGTVGGIDRSTATYWRNNVDVSVDKADMVQTMEQHWRACTRNGGRPDLIIAGSDWIDQFRTQVKSEIARYTMVSPQGQTAEMDPAVTGLHFNGVPIIWDPVFQDLDDALSPTYDWEDRCYFINTKHLRLRPAQGHNMITRKPPREYNRYVYYWALTWKGSLTCNRMNGHSVLVWSGS
jgi:hypothetical protein